MKLLKAFSGMILAFVLNSALEADDVAQSQQTKDCGWCVVTCPKEVAPDVSIEVKVELKGLKERTKLSSDLHWMKPDGAWGGCLAWGGGGRDVEKDGVQTFNFTFEAKEGMGSAHALVFLSPNGEWNGNTKNATGPEMSLKAKTP